MKIGLFYFALSVIIFVLISFIAIIFGAKEIIHGYYLPSGEFLPELVGRWEFKTNPILYLTDSFVGLSLDDYISGHQFIYFYWYFLSLAVTFILYKLRIHKFFKFLS